MVVPASDGLAAPAVGGPAQREREMGAGDQSAGGLLGQAGQPGGLGDGQLDEAGAGRAWLAAADGNGRVAERNQQVIVVNVIVVVIGGAGLGCGCPRGAGWIAPVRALRMAAHRSWARAARAVCRQIPSQVRTCDWSQPSVSLPVLKVSSAVHLYVPNRLR